MPAFQRLEVKEPRDVVFTRLENAKTQLVRARARYDRVQGDTHFDDRMRVIHSSEVRDWEKQIELLEWLLDE